MDAEVVPIERDTGAAADGAGEDVEAASDAGASSSGGGGGGGGGGRGGDKESKILSFQALSTRKRKGVTAQNAGELSGDVAVKVFAFDLLYLGKDGKGAEGEAEGKAEAEGEGEGQDGADGVSGSLLNRPFRERRDSLYRSFSVENGAFGFAERRDFSFEVETVKEGAGRKKADEDEDEDEDGEASDGTVEGGLGADIDAFLHLSIESGCEGLMAKHLDSPYVPCTTRNETWIKLKKDYVEGLGDTFDLVPIGGWRGDGRKSEWISPFLLACWDPETSSFQSVCRVMSGFRSVGGTGIHECCQNAVHRGAPVHETLGPRPLALGPWPSALGPRPLALGPRHCPALRHRVRT